MTDTNIADKVYMEPLNLEYVARIIRMERPDAIIPTLGGQTGLNLAMQLAQKGVLDECGVEILGTPFDSIDQAEDREKFKDLCVRIGEPVLESYIAHSVEQAKEVGGKDRLSHRAPSGFYPGRHRRRFLRQRGRTAEPGRKRPASVPSGPGTGGKVHQGL